jgi:hypothetical protein
MTAPGRHVGYNPVDEVSREFHEKGISALVRGIMGARGTGKSGTCIMDGLRGASQQNVSRTGVRRSRFLVLRDTYRQLETTTIPSFKKWLGPVSRIHGNYPIRALTRIPSLQHDGTAIEMETVFLAMDGENIIENLQSLEASFAWINEARAIENPNIVNMVLASCGRYPSKDEEGCNQRFVVMDSNPPDDSHWWHRADVVDRPPGWHFYTQESPLVYKHEGQRESYSNRPEDYTPNPRALYARIQNAGYNYWLDLIPNASDAFIRTMVMGRYGTFVAGKPVYGLSWTEEVVAKEALTHNQAIQIVAGIDTSGLHPAAVFGQLRQGTVHILGELHVKDTPFEEFLDAAFIPYCMERFPNCSIFAVLDPSNPRAGIGGKNALQVCQSRGIAATLAPTNIFNRRIGAVTTLLMRRKALVIDPRAQLLLAGFRGKYRYEKIEAQGIQEVYKPQPVKDEYADVHDGMQYLCLYYQFGRQEQKIIVPQKRVLMA